MASFIKHFVLLFFEHLFLNKHDKIINFSCSNLINLSNTSTLKNAKKFRCLQFEDKASEVTSKVLNKLSISKKSKWQKAWKNTDVAKVGFYCVRIQQKILFNIGQCFSYLIDKTENMVFWAKVHSLCKEFCTRIWCQLWLAWKGFVMRIIFSNTKDCADTVFKVNGLSLE